MKSYPPYLWATLSAIAMAFAFPSWDFYFLAYISVIFQLIAIHQCTQKKEIWIIAFLGPQIANFIAFSWVSYVLQEIGQIPFLLAKLFQFFFGFICLPTYSSFLLSLYFLRSFIHHIPLHLRSSYVALLWLSLEFLWRPFKIFPESLGSSQLPWLSLSQFASIGGVESISFFIVFIGASFFFYYQAKKAHYAFIITTILSVLLHFWGSNRIEQLRKLPKDFISFAVAQANIGNVDKIIAKQGNQKGLMRVVESYLTLNKIAAKEKPDLILWPETAYPMNFPASIEHRASRLSRKESFKIFQNLKEHSYSLLFGTYEHIASREYNSVILLGADAQVQGIYRKHYLLLFGEYMPLSHIWPELKKLNPLLGNFSNGPGPQPILWKHKGKEIVLGIHICYETLISSYMRKMASLGTQAFVNFTNDSWFGPGSEPYQHLALSIFRSIENGVPLLRATNTGFSALIDANGEKILRSSLFKKEILSGKLPIYKENIKTYYQKYAHLYPPISTGLFLLFSTVLYLYCRKQNKEEKLTK